MLQLPTNRFTKTVEKVQDTCDVNKVLDFWCIDLLIPEEEKISA